MSFVGTRPEVVKYVKKYKPEYFATLLLPAGITSEASIKYKDEAELLDAAEDVDEVYITKVESFFDIRAPILLIKGIPEFRPFIRIAQFFTGS